MADKVVPKGDWTAFRCTFFRRPAMHIRDQVPGPDL